jgi:hypothetical protein
LRGGGRKLKPVRDGTSREGRVAEDGHPTM